MHGYRGPPRAGSRSIRCELLIWPWPDPRFLVPVAPLLITAACAGLMLGAGARHSRWARAILLVSALIAVTGNLLLARDLGAMSHQSGPIREPGSSSGEVARVRGRIRLAAPLDALRCHGRFGHRPQRVLYTRAGEDP